MCGRKLFSKSKDCTNDFESCDCLGDRCRRCYLWRMQEACRYIKEYGRYIKELVRNGGIILDLKETRSPSPLSNYPFVVSLVLYFKNRRKLDNFNLRVSWYTSKKNTIKFSMEIPHLISTVHRLLFDRFLC